jgi:hypothetical protein
MTSTQLSGAVAVILVVADKSLKTDSFIGLQAAENSTPMMRGGLIYPVDEELIFSSIEILCPSQLRLF